MSTNRPIAELILGDKLTLGQTFGGAAEVTFKESSLGAKDAVLLVEGNVQITGELQMLGSPPTIILNGSTGVIAANDVEAVNYTVNGVPLDEFVEGLNPAGLEPPVVLDQILHAVPGQANTFYIDKGATSHGYNVQVDAVTGRPLFWLLRSGVEMRLGNDFEIVRSLSTGPEGPAAVGSLNALHILEPVILQSPVIWYDYYRDDEATS